MECTRAGAHTRAARSPDRFVAHPQTYTFLESARDEGDDALICVAFPHFRRRERELERKQVRKNDHVAGKKGGRCCRAP